MERSLYVVGRIAKAFGVRGELVVDQVSSPPSRFENLRSIMVGRASQTVEKKAIEAIRPGGKGMRIKFSGVDTRNEAEELIGHYLFVDGNERVKLPQNFFYVDDVVGLRVLDEEGRILGKVAEVLKMPAQDVYVIDRESGRMMVPAVREFIRNIDLTTGTMTVRLIEGMDAS